jgi:hypothetical protein
MGVGRSTESYYIAFVARPENLSKWLIESVNLWFALLLETRAVSGRLFGEFGKAGRKTTSILRRARW